MHLKRLEIRGFKTFARHTVLEFRPGISAIVGPNGSGKSNIADAIRWVLGEQGYASLRCKRSEELLFSGSEHHPPVAQAEVLLTIDNSDRLLPLDFEEVTIGRRTGRSGDNEYLINGKKVRLRDIQEATEPLGSSYTIINQGLVDTALTLRPEERRRLFEQAAELKSFEVRRDEAERRLSETDANMQRIADLLSELEPRLRSLKRQASQARQQREISAQLHDLLVAYYADQWRTARQDQSSAEARLLHLRSSLEETRHSQESAAAELQQMRDLLHSHQQQRDSHQQQRAAVQSRLETARRQLSLAQDRLDTLRQRREEVLQTSSSLEASYAEAAQECSNLAAALAEAETHLAEQREHLAACTDEATAFEQSRRHLENELTLAQEEVLKASTGLAEQRSRIEHLAAQRERLAHDQDSLDATLRRDEEQFAQASQQAAAARHAAATAEAARSKAARMEEEAGAAYEALRQARSSADDTLAAARRTLSDVQARLDALSRLAQSYTGVFPGVKAALQWAERSGRAGFALVSSILHVPQQLETAIEVALGARLQNIVVETWQDAEDAIAELKRSRAGRATFLPLDTIRKSEHRDTRAGQRPTGGEHNNAVLGIAADLVGYDRHYHAVASYLLGRTLVVRDLAAARQEVQRLPGGWMIVTLAGEQVSSGGAVTGGAQAKETGTLQRERELRTLPDQVNEAQQALASAEAACRTLDERLLLARQAMREAADYHQQASKQEKLRRAELDAAAQRAAQIEQELTWRSERREVVARDLETLAEQEQRLLAQQDKAESRLAIAQEHLNELRTRQQASAQSDRAVQERLAALRAAAAHAEAHVSTQRTLHAAQLQARERLARQRDEQARQLQSFTAECEQLDTASRRAEQEYQALLAEQHAIQDEIDPLEESLRMEQARLAELEQQEKQITAARFEQEAACNRADLDLQRAQDRLENLLARAAADGIALEQEQIPDSSLPTAFADASELAAEIERLRERLRRFGAVNSLAPEEYAEAAAHHEFMQQQLDDLHQAKKTLRDLIAELNDTMQKQFLQTFKAVAREFERYFTRLFGGGTARLQLVSKGGATSGNSDDEAASGKRTPPLGIEIVARPPGKRQQNLSLLSGGERALTASALLFAILSVNPSPFCILDEVDAALDESNVGRFRDALSDLTRRTQFILISHNRGTIEAAETLYGVTMGEDSISGILSLRVETALEHIA